MTADALNRANLFIREDCIVDQEICDLNITFLFRHSKLLTSVSFYYFFVIIMFVRIFIYVMEVLYYFIHSKNSFNRLKTFFRKMYTVKCVRIIVKTAQIISNQSIISLKSIPAGRVTFQGQVGACSLNYPFTRQQIQNLIIFLYRPYLSSLCQRLEEINLHYNTGCCSVISQILKIKFPDNNVLQYKKLFLFYIIIETKPCTCYSEK